MLTNFFSNLANGDLLLEPKVTFYPAHHRIIIYHSQSSSATRTLNTRTKTAAVPIPKNKNLTIDIPSQTPVKASSSVAPSAAFGNHFSTPTASSTPLSHPWEPPKLSEQVAEEERQGLTDVQQTTANEIVGEIVQTIEETIAADGETDAYESDSDVDSIASQSGESKGYGWRKIIQYCYGN